MIDELIKNKLSVRVTLYVPYKVTESDSLPSIRFQDFKPISARVFLNGQKSPHRENFLFFR